MSTNLLSALEKIGSQHILCIGDVMLDRFVYGEVERISPEAPIPILHVQREMSCLGAAGNVLRNIHSLGGQTDFIAVVGADTAGHEVAQQLLSVQGVTSFLYTDAARPTTVKTRYVCEGQQLLRVDHEQIGPVVAEVEEQILAQIAESVAQCDVVVLSDYAKGVLSDRVVRAAIERARRHKRPILIDPKGRDYSRYQGASFLTPNRKELAEIAGFKIITMTDAERAARVLIDFVGLDGVIAKLGSDGICLVRKDKPAQHFHTKAREVFDVSGAGDTVIATLALVLAAGLAIEAAVELANLAGSIVVGKVGTATIGRDDLAHALMEHESDLGQDKVATRQAVTLKTERWRKQGFKVGFTNGCFDLLHPGHISLLRQARAACDKLVVGLNSDASVKRLKGETRPVQSEAARAAVLASLSDVDLVVIFDEDTPYDLIKAARPDILVKGADYEIHQVVGADLVREWGGKTVLATLVDGQSTTATIQKLKMPST